MIVRAMVLMAFCAASFLAVAAAAQAQDKRPAPDPCASLTAYQKSQLDLTLHDWGNLAHYKAANAALAAPAVGESRVVLWAIRSPKAGARKIGPTATFFPVSRTSIVA